MLVSIITPMFNSAEFINATILSVKRQTFTDWEMIIVDDNSTDKSAEIITEKHSSDKRIKYYKLNNNHGPGYVRNVALGIAEGEFITFLDADDLWTEQHLEKQLAFMRQKCIAFSCSSYQVIDRYGCLLNKKVLMPEKLTYQKYLSLNILQTFSVMIDTNQIKKETLKFPEDINTREDAIFWLSILKRGWICYGMKDILSYYRRVKNSRSSRNRLKAVKNMWDVYTKYENISFFFASYFYIRYIFLAVWKRIYLSKSSFSK